MSQPNFRVLVADDTQANRTLLRAYLGRLGFDTVMAEDGMQAITQFSAAAPDIVLMDLMMPGVDGFEAIRRIREIPSSSWVPIIIVSAMDAEYDVVRGLEAGADDYLTKPLSYQVFAAKMRNIARTLEFQRARETAIKRESTVADAVVDGIVSFDAQGVIVNCNRAARQIFASESGDLESLHFSALLAEDERFRFSDALRRHLEGQGDPLIGRVVEVMAVDRRRRSFPMELCVSELPGGDRRLFIGVVRDISERKRVERQLAENASRLQSYHDEAEAEAELAKEIMERLVRREGLSGRGVHHLIVPTQRFSGDMVLAARSPSGRLYGMVADATGHGLAAAMCGLAVVGDFYDSVADDEPLAEMLANMNNALCAMLPGGRFVSVSAVCLDDARHTGEVFVGGMPDVLQLAADGSVRRGFSSHHLPLGIEPVPASGCSTLKLHWEQPGRLLLCSDGILEAASADGREFGLSGLERALHDGPDEQLQALERALQAHLGGLGAHDDMSVLLLDLNT